jgi:hypothetical protein
VTETLTQYRRKIPPDRAPLLVRMGELLEANGYHVPPADLESAWSAHCLESVPRGSWDLTRFVSDDLMLTYLLAQLEPVPEMPADIEIKEPRHDEAIAEQDDEPTAQGEAGGEPAIEQSGGEAPEAPKRRGRPPGRPKKVGVTA